MLSFEEYIAKANQSTSVDELLNVFLETVKQHGYDKMIFCLLSDHSSLGLEAGVGYLRNYPADWMKYYFEQHFDQIDPVIRYCYQKMTTFSWAEMSERMDLTRKQKKCLNLGVEAGLHNGVCTPLWGGPHRFAGIGLASSEKKDACDGNNTMITYYCQHFYYVFQRLHAPKDVKNPLPNIFFTFKETEILTRVAEGKSDPDIAQIMGITEHAVDFHLRNIYNKLDARTRIYAAAKAIQLGLISPNLRPWVKA